MRLVYKPLFCCLQLTMREMWATGELQQLLAMARETTLSFDLVR